MPATTFTAVTWPETAKLRFDCWAGAIVPDDDRVCRSVVVVAVATPVEPHPVDELHGVGSVAAARLPADMRRDRSRLIPGRKARVAGAHAVGAVVPHLGLHRGVAAVERHRQPEPVCERGLQTRGGRLELDERAEGVEQDTADHGDVSGCRKRAICASAR